MEQVSLVTNDADLSSFRELIPFILIVLLPLSKYGLQHYVRSQHKAYLEARKPQKGLRYIFYPNWHKVPVALLISCPHEVALIFFHPTAETA